MRGFICAVFLCCIFFSCTQLDVYEKNTVIPKMAWQSNFNATGNFIITDTIAAYNIYVVLRHVDAYAYNNIWLNVALQAPGDDSLRYQKINLPLGTDATGWYGVGIDDIWEVRKLISGSAKPFKNKGEYRFSIAQIMRDNPLLNIMSVGLRIEKAN